MKYLLGLMIFLNVADSVLTHLIVGNGAGREGNPLLMPIVGEPVFFGIKVLGATVCAIILWDIYRRHRRLATVTTAVIVAFYTGIVFWNGSILIV
jgi:hypothetical protein